MPHALPIPTCGWQYTANPAKTICHYHIASPRAHLHSDTATYAVVAKTAATIPIKKLSPGTLVPSVGFM
jgi:hypothetical protein